MTSLDKFYCLCCNKEYFKKTYKKHSLSITHKKREHQYLNRKNIRCPRKNKINKVLIVNENEHKL